MRVLNVTGSLDPLMGGTTEAVINTCVASRKTDVDTTLLYAVTSHARPRNSEGEAILRAAGVRLFGFSVLAGTNVRASGWGVSTQLVRWLLDHVADYDLVHLHGCWGLPQITGLIAATREGVPSVMTPHETLTHFDVRKPGNVPRQGAKLALKSFYTRRLSLIVYSSHLEADDSLPDRQPSPTRTVVIAHPLREALAAPEVGERPTTGPLRIGFIGRFHPKKNIELLIAAVHRVSPDACLLIAGDGPPKYRSELEGLVADLDMQERVHWAGFVSGPSRWEFLDSLDLLAMPSQYECFGLVAAEAMARGTPVVVSERTGIAKLVAESSCGRTSEPSVEGFAEALAAFQGSRRRLRELGGRGAVAAENALSLQAYGAAIRECYQTLPRTR